MPRTSRSFSHALTVAAAVALGLPLVVGACSSEGAATSAPEPLAHDEAALLFGDDRIADVLAKDFTRVPRSYEAFEKTFGVGRACARTDSKEIYVIEEPSTRFGGVQRALPSPVPRAAVAGCSAPAGDERPSLAAHHSFELFVALVSAPEAPHFAQGDGIVVDQVETIALDRTTGLYSFYVVSPEGMPGAVQRIVMAPDGVVEQRTKELGKPMVTTRAAPGDVNARRCFNCHANGEPIMNELTDPWTNWVSARKPRVLATDLTGETLAIVSESKAPALSPNQTNRGSFAGALEVTLRSALRELALGQTGSADSGLGRAIVDGRQPGGVARLLRSTFCETALNYLSASPNVVPIELFVDPAAFDGESIARPVTVAGASFPVALPIRSEVDKALEAFLVREGYLTADLALAVRLVDDVNDVFSTARCGLLASVTSGLAPVPTPTDVASRVRAALASYAASGALTNAPRRVFLEALIAPTTTADARTAARASYLEDARKALDVATATLGTDAGRTTLAARLFARHDQARVLFPGNANPLPVFDDTPPSSQAKN